MPTERRSDALSVYSPSTSSHKEGPPLSPCSPSPSGEPPRPAAAAAAGGGSAAVMDPPARSEGRAGHGRGGCGGGGGGAVRRGGDHIRARRGEEEERHETPQQRPAVDRDLGAHPRPSAQLLALDHDAQPAPIGRRLAVAHKGRPHTRSVREESSAVATAHRLRLDADERRSQRPWAGQRLRSKKP